MAIEPADDVFLDRARERSKKFALRNVVVKASTQIVADVGSELFARMIDGGQIRV